MYNYIHHQTNKWGFTCGKPQAVGIYTPIGVL